MYGQPVQFGADGRMEGVQVGDQVVLFGRDGAVDPAAPVSYEVSGAAHHLLVDLRPGQAYEVTVDGSPLTTLTASAQGTIAFATPAGGTQTVTVTASP